MNFYSFGEPDNPVIMLFPGTCCHWKNNFDGVINLLKKDFYVVCVSYDGFDESEKSEFPDMIRETMKIEEYIKNRFKGKIHAAYGCSLGGSFVGLLVQRKNIHINHGIIGSSDLDQASQWTAKLQTALVVPLLHRMISKGKMSKSFRKRMEKSSGEEYTKQALHMFGENGVSMNFVTKKSIKNQFYSDLVTELKEGIQVPGTTIHCFYAEKMGEQYLERYRRYFVNPHIVSRNLNHEELLVCRPEEWVQAVKACVLEESEDNDEG